MCKKITLGAAIIANGSAIISSAQGEYEFKEKDGKFYVGENAYDSIEGALEQLEKAFLFAYIRNNDRLSEERVEIISNYFKAIVAFGKIRKTEKLLKNQKDIENNKREMVKILNDCLKNGYLYLKGRFSKSNVSLPSDERAPVNMFCYVEDFLDYYREHVKKWEKGYILNDVGLEKILINVLKQEDKITIMFTNGEILEEIFFNDKNAISKILNWRLIFAKTQNMYKNLFGLYKKGDLVFKFQESKENYLVFEMSKELAPLYKNKFPKKQGKSTISKIFLTEKTLKIVLDNGEKIDYNLLDAEHIEGVVKFTVNVSRYSYGLHKGLIKRPGEKKNFSEIENESKVLDS